MADLLDSQTRYQIYVNNGGTLTYQEWLNSGSPTIPSADETPTNGTDDGTPTYDELLAMASDPSVNKQSVYDLIREYYPNRTLEFIRTTAIYQDIASFDGGIYTFNDGFQVTYDPNTLQIVPYGDSTTELGLPDGSVAMVFNSSGETVLYQAPDGNYYAWDSGTQKYTLVDKATGDTMVQTYNDQGGIIPSGSTQVADGVYLAPDGNYYNKDGIQIDSQYAQQIIAAEQEQIQGNMSDYEQAYIDYLNQENTIRLQELDAEKQATAAQMLANPASWLEYAAYTGTQAAVQPWMLPLQSGDYPELTAGAPLKGWGPDWEAYYNGTGPKPTTGGDTTNGGTTGGGDWSLSGSGTIPTINGTNVNTSLIQAQKEYALAMIAYQKNPNPQTLAALQAAQVKLTQAQGVTPTTSSTPSIPTTTTQTNTALIQAQSDYARAMMAYTQNPNPQTLATLSQAQTALAQAQGGGTTVPTGATMGASGIATSPTIAYGSATLPSAVDRTLSGETTTINIDGITYEIPVEYLQYGGNNGVNPAWADIYYGNSSNSASKYIYDELGNLILNPNYNPTNPSAFYSPTGNPQEVVAHGPASDTLINWDDQSYNIYGGAGGQPQHFAAGSTRYDAWVAQQNAIADGYYLNEQQWLDMARAKASGAPYDPIFDVYSPNTADYGGNTTTVSGWASDQYASQTGGTAPTANSQDTNQVTQDAYAKNAQMVAAYDAGEITRQQMSEWAKEYQTLISGALQPMADGGVIDRPTVLYDLYTGKPYGTAGEGGIKELVTPISNIYNKLQNKFSGAYGNYAAPTRAAYGSTAESQTTTTLSQAQQAYALAMMAYQRNPNPQTLLALQKATTALAKIQSGSTTTSTPTTPTVVTTPTVTTPTTTTTTPTTTPTTTSSGYYDPSQMIDLERPETQYQARMGPDPLAQYYAYEQARTGATPEETEWRLYSYAPPSGSYENMYYRR